MSDDRHDDFEIYDDAEEHVDEDEHARARADVEARKAREQRRRTHVEDVYDEFTYGAESGDLESEDEEA